MLRSLAAHQVRFPAIAITRSRVFAPLCAPALFGRSICSSRIAANAISHKLNMESHVGKYVEEGPSLVKYTLEHEWVAAFPDQSVFVGITKYAADALGDVTYVELPEVGDMVEIGSPVGSIESVKSASEIYSPVTGEIVAINTELESTPGLLNEDPIGAGWIAHIKLSSADSISPELMTEAEYESSLEEHD